LDKKISVLDHGYARLVDHMGSDLSVSRAARVSYDAAWRAGDIDGSDGRLIKRLWNDHHTSPFEAVVFTFEIFAPIFVFRQWHRHRTWGYNELSGRYKELPEIFYLPNARDVGVQATDNKQGRETSDKVALIARRMVQLDRIKRHNEDGFQLYRELLNDEEFPWPRELARSHLPLSTYSHMFGTVNLLNLFRFLMLRAHPHAQMEIRVYAEAMTELAREIVPVCVQVFEAKAKRQVQIDRMLSFLKIKNRSVEELEALAMKEFA
jgi:thymidylate synthase (FAD)